MENRQTPPLANPHVKVLVVDDHPNTANMMARAISHLGSHVDVVSATSGVEALQLVEDGAVDILITDMMMPEMTGMELIETLNEKPCTTPAVSFLLTAHDSTGVRDIAEHLNVREVISKPVHPEWICQLISQTLDELKRSKPADEAQPEMELNLDLGQEDTDVAELLWEVARKFQLQGDAKNQLLVFGETTSNIKVRGNMAQLRQAVRSLVWCAIHNTPRGGSVILSSENGLDTVKISVRDTGYGNGNKENELNHHELAIASSIAEGHGGIVAVESEPGKGTCYSITLPVQRMKISCESDINVIL